MLERLRYSSVRYQFQVALLPGRVEQGLGEHLDVIEAVVSGDEAEAESQMRAHLTSVIAGLQKLSDLGAPPTVALGNTEVLHQTSQKGSWPVARSPFARLTPESVGTPGCSRRCT